MPSQASAKFEIKSWKEKTYDEKAGRPKLTRASVKSAYTGDLVGKGTLEYLMSYHGDNASYVSLERVVGRLGGHKGSFVLQGQGTFENNTAKSTVSVVPGSGTGDLANLTGKGTVMAEQEKPDSQQLVLEYDFE
ncbi:MAG TPA: DUF3224 domain-containing protein [Chloroflexota bacterium]|nr:DUF3224 domain-containing protein [Chloroflexota bacterium]